MPKILVFFLLILSLYPISLVLADELPILEPDLILTDKVKLMEELPIVDSFNEDDTIRYFDPIKREWQIFDYPEGTTSINYVEPRSDGTYLLMGYDYGELVPSSIDRTWIFDPSIGTIIRPPSQCDVAQDLAGEGRWIYYKPEDGLIYLCNTETGKLSPALPSEVQETFNFPLQADTPLMSPNGKTIIFSDNEYWEPTIYSFDVDTQSFSVYGSTEENNGIRYQWITNSIVLAISHTLYDFNIYRIELEKEEVIQHIASQISRPPYINVDVDSPYLIWTDMFNFETRQITVEHKIVRVDLLTGDSSILFTKDCKAYNESVYCLVTNFVPNPTNQKYLALIADQNGYTEAITILNLEKQNIVYQAYTEKLSPFAWLDETSFIFNDKEDTFPEPQGFMQVAISDDAGIETRLENVYTPIQSIFLNPIYLRVSPDGHYILSYDQTELKGHATQVFLYDVIKQERYPITESVKDLGYGFTANWNDDGTIEISVYRDLNDIGKWLVSIEN